MKQHIGGAEEMTQQLRAYTALEELSSGSQDPCLGVHSLQ